MHLSAEFSMNEMFNGDSNTYSDYINVHYLHYKSITAFAFLLLDRTDEQDSKVMKTKAGRSCVSVHRLTNRTILALVI